MDTDAEATRLLVELLQLADRPDGPDRCLNAEQLRHYPFDACDVLRRRGLLVAAIDDDLFTERYGTPLPLRSVRSVDEDCERTSAHLRDFVGCSPLDGSPIPDSRQDFYWRLTWRDRYPGVLEEVLALLRGDDGFRATPHFHEPQAIFWQLHWTTLLRQIPACCPWAFRARVCVPDALWHIGRCDGSAVYLARGLSQPEVRSRILASQELSAHKSPILLTPLPDPADHLGATPDRRFAVRSLREFVEVREGRLQPPSRACQETASSPGPPSAGPAQATGLVASGHPSSAASASLHCAEPPLPDKCRSCKYVRECNGVRPLEPNYRRVCFRGREIPEGEFTTRQSAIVRHLHTNTGDDPTERYLVKDVAKANSDRLEDVFKGRRGVLSGPKSKDPLIISGRKPGTRRLRTWNSDL